MRRSSWKVAIFVISILFILPPGISGQQPNNFILSNIEVVTIEDDLMVVTWTTNSESSTTVRYGEDESLENEASVEGETRFHYCMIGDLEPETEYYFQVVSGGAVSEVMSFSTLSETPLRSSRIIVAADMHYDVNGINLPSGSMNGECANIVDSFIGEAEGTGGVRAVILLGDNVQGDQEDWQELYEDRLNGGRLDIIKVPHDDVLIYPVMGNWDKNSPDWEDHYSEYVGFPSTYYSFDIANYHLIIPGICIEMVVAREDVQNIGILRNDEFESVE